MLFSAEISSVFLAILCSSNRDVFLQLIRIC
nr:MAG TPA: hypothetical protein [Caudoviricetes sp.]